MLSSNIGWVFNLLFFRLIKFAIQFCAFSPTSRLDGICLDLHNHNSLCINLLSLTATIFGADVAVQQSSLFSTFYCNAALVFHVFLWSELNVFCCYLLSWTLFIFSDGSQPKNYFLPVSVDRGYLNVSSFLTAKIFREEFLFERNYIIFIKSMNFTFSRKFGTCCSVCAEPLNDHFFAIGMRFGVTAMCVF